MWWPATILFWCFIGQPSHACMNPADQWAAGVVWSNNEQGNFSLIEQMGQEGTHYLKEVDQDTQVVFKYRSHYDPLHTMVFLGFYRPSYQPAVAPRLAVLLDTAQNKDTYDFAASVRIELDWLNQYSIVVMSAAARQEVEDSLRTAGSGDAQFWTLQHDILPYNSWYEYDTLKGSWSVNAVRTYNGCGLDLAFELPPAELAASAIKKMAGTIDAVECISVWPNPLRSQCIIKLFGKHDLSIHNIAGTCLSTLSGNTWNGKDNGGHEVPSGVYYLTIDGRYEVKIVKLDRFQENHQ